MTKTEEIRLHNLFIKFKNEGKGIDEIKGLLEVDGEVLEGWNGAFEKMKEELKKTSNLGLERIEGIHLKENGLNYSVLIPVGETSQLDEVKGFLRNTLNYYKNEPEDELDTKMLAQMSKSLFIFEQYFMDLNFDENGEANYILNSYTDDALKLANQAIEFYKPFNHFQRLQTTTSLIKEVSEDYYLKASQILPFALKALKAKNYEGIIKIELDNLSIDTNWIFLIGENGYGKTTILRSISIGFGDLREIDEILPDFYIEKNLIGIEYFSLSKSIINNVGGRDFTVFPHLACYGPSRLQIQTDQTQNDIAKKSTTTYSLFNSDGILLNIEFELLIWYLEKNPRFDAVKQTFLKLIPYLSDIQVDVPQRKIFYIEKEPIENGSKYNRVTFNQLASGFRSILAMVGDMMIRLFKSQPEITEPSELAGIVIIDELDLHWHPKMQREIPSLLSSIFPKVQFIASTHSLVPLLGAPENSVLLKVNRTVEEGITVEKVDIDFQALSSDTMLRDIFDLEEYMSDPKIRAWERYKELKRLIRSEEDIDKKETYMDERREIGNKYTFPA